MSVVSALNREDTPSFPLAITATDSLPANGDERSASATYTITVTDINDNDPVFNPTSYGVLVLEGATVAANIVQVRLNMGWLNAKVG